MRLIYVVQDKEGEPRVHSAEDGNLRPSDVLIGWAYGYVAAVEAVEKGEWLEGMA